MKWLGATFGIAAGHADCCDAAGVARKATSAYKIRLHWR